MVIKMMIVPNSGSSRYNYFLTIAVEFEDSSEQYELMIVPNNDNNFNRC